MRTPFGETDRFGDLAVNLVVQTFIVGLVEEAKRDVTVIGDVGPAPESIALDLYGALVKTSREAKHYDADEWASVAILLAAAVRQIRDLVTREDGDGE